MLLYLNFLTFFGINDIYVRTSLESSFRQKLNSSNTMHYHWYHLPYYIFSCFWRDRIFDMDMGSLFVKATRCWTLVLISYCKYLETNLNKKYFSHNRDSASDSGLRWWMFGPNLTVILLIKWKRLQNWVFVLHKFERLPISHTFDTASAIGPSRLFPALLHFILAFYASLSFIQLFV